METVTTLILLQSIGARLILLSFMFYLLYSFWKKTAQPFLSQEQEESANNTQKTKEKQVFLQNLIFEQEKENELKKKYLLSIKECFLFWHTHQIQRSTQHILEKEKKEKEHLERMQKKELVIQKLKQQKAELSMITSQLLHQAQATYAGSAGAERLKKLIKDLNHEI